MLSDVVQISGNIIQQIAVEIYIQLNIGIYDKDIDLEIRLVSPL